MRVVEGYAGDATCFGLSGVLIMTDWSLGKVIATPLFELSEDPISAFSRSLKGRKRAITRTEHSAAMIRVGSMSAFEQLIFYCQWEC